MCHIICCEWKSNIKSHIVIGQAGLAWLIKHTIISRRLINSGAIAIKNSNKKANSMSWLFYVSTEYGGGGRIRTIEGGAGRFTVCSLWPLGNPSRVFFLSLLIRLNWCFPNTSLKCGAHLIKLAPPVNCFFSKLNWMLSFSANSQLIERFSRLSHSVPYTFTGNLYVPWRSSCVSLATI